MSTPNLQIPNINTLFGAPLIGVLIASFLSGIVTVQAFLYFRQYPKDAIALKSLVAFTWLLDIAHLISITYFIYYHTITHWGNTGVVAQFTWSWGVELFLNTIIMFTCQCFLIYRFKIISDGNWWITSVLVLLALTQFISGLFSSFKGLIKGVTPEIVANAESKTTGSMWLISGAVTDVLIAISLAYYLHAKSGMKSAVVDRLILYVCSTGALTSVVAVANIATYLAMPSTFLHLALNFPLGRIYTNSLLCSLNMRVVLKKADRTSSIGGFTVSAPRITVSTEDFDPEIRRNLGPKRSDRSSTSTEL